MSTIASINDRFNARLLHTLCASSLVLSVPAMLINMVLGNVGVAVSLLVMSLSFGYGLQDIGRHGITLRTSLLVGSTLGLVIVSLVYLVGVPAIMWIFPLAVANYVVLPTRFALLLNILCILAIAPAVFADASTAIRFLPAIVLVNLFLHIFSGQLERKSVLVNRMVLQDKLTNVGNRRALDEMMENIRRSAGDHNQQVALLLLDLDHFKRVNDTWGHQEGDRVLKDFSQLVATRLRRGDHLFRFGGEEFIVILGNTGLDGAVSLAEEFRLMVAGAQLGPASDLTVSIGVACLEPGETMDLCLTRADSALYEAKKSGRNLVRTSACNDPGPDRRATPEIYSP